MKGTPVRTLLASYLCVRSRTGSRRIAEEGGVCLTTVYFSLFNLVCACKSMMSLRFVNRPFVTEVRCMQCIVKVVASFMCTCVRRCVHVFVRLR